MRFSSAPYEVMTNAQGESDEDLSKLRCILFYLDGCGLYTCGVRAQDIRFQVFDGSFIGFEIFFFKWLNQKLVVLTGYRSGLDIITIFAIVRGGLRLQIWNNIKTGLLVSRITAQWSRHQAPGLLGVVYLYLLDSHLWPQREGLFNVKAAVGLKPPWVLDQCSDSVLLIRSLAEI